MKKSAPGDDWPSPYPRPRPAPRYHVISIAMPFLGLAVAFGFLFLTPHFGGLHHWPDMSKQDHRWMTLAFWLIGVAGVVGLFAAGKSIARKEQPGFLAAIGMILNIPPVLLWLLRMAEILIDGAGVVSHLRPIIVLVSCDERPWVEALLPNLARQNGSYDRLIRVAGTVGVGRDTIDRYSIMVLTGISHSAGWIRSPMHS